MFWSVIIEPGKRYSRTVDDSFHLSMATLDVKSVASVPANEIHPVCVKVDNKDDVILCNLSKSSSPQVPLDLLFRKGDSVSFFTTGKAVVHLTGYLLEAEEDDIEDMSEEESDESEEEQNEVEASSNKKTTKKVGLNSTEKPKAESVKRKSVEPIQEKSNKIKKKETDKNAAVDSDDDSDEDDDDFVGAEAEDEDDSSDEDDDLDEEDEDEEEEEEEDDDDDEEEDSSDEEDSSPDVKVTSSAVKNKLIVQNGVTPSKKAKQSVGGSPVSNKTPNQQQQKTPKNENQKTPKNENQKTPKNENQKTPKNENQVVKNQTPKSEKKQQGDQKTPKGEKGKTPVKVEAGKGTPGTPAKKIIEGGVIVEELKLGNGPVAKPGKMVTVYYTGRLKSNNKVFDETLQGPGFKFRLGKSEVIKGMDVAVNGMKVGSKRKITLPPHMAYGSKGSPPTIPPNSTLVFDIELKAVS